MKLLVTGSRSWTDRERLFNVLDEFHQRVGITIVIEGCAAGADRMAEAWADERAISQWHFPADWTLGKSAGARRNSRMLADAEPELVIAFHDGTSKGTADMIAKAKGWGLEPVVIREGEERD